MFMNMFTKLENDHELTKGKKLKEKSEQKKLRRMDSGLSSVNQTIFDITAIGDL